MSDSPAIDAEFFATHETGEERIPRCLRCDYILIGLPSSRCPECGGQFDWEQVRRAAARRPAIAFERAPGLRKVPAFFLTAVTILLAPWIFARQVTRRVRAGHALAFGAICALGPLASSLVADGDSEFIATWLATAVVYVVVQAVALALVDFSGWPRPLHSLAHWFLVGCYTSAVMLTEFRFGPPPISFGDVLHIHAAEFELDRANPGELLVLAQMIVWLTGLACCYRARLARTHAPAPVAWAASALVWIGALVLYAVVYQDVGHFFLSLF